MPPVHRYIDLLVAALRRAFPDGPPECKFGVWDTSAMSVPDCVLCLNRKYYSFSEPRLDRFCAAHPTVEMVGQMLGLIGGNRTPLEFSVRELDYRDSERATTFVGVCRHMEAVQSVFPGETEPARLRQ
jgi:hypothetical protein